MFIHGYRVYHSVRKLMQLIMKTGATNLQEKQYTNTCHAVLLTMSADSTRHQIGCLNIYIYSEKLKQKHFTSATKTFMCWFFSLCVKRIQRLLELPCSSSKRCVKFQIASMLHLNLHFLSTCSITIIHNLCHFKGHIEINNIKRIMLMHNLKFG